MAETANQRPGASATLRFGAFLVVLVAAGLTVSRLFAQPANISMLGGFDIASILFLASLIPLFRHGDEEAMRARAKANDANRTMMLVITSGVTIAILVAVATELIGNSAKSLPMVAFAIGSLGIAWIFSNTVYAMHYAHLFYVDDGHDTLCGGLDFPSTDYPDYWDFVYFAFTLGMTFQTSDVALTGGHMRRVVTMHCLAAFLFNLGILAFSINVLGNIKGG